MSATRNSLLLAVASMSACYGFCDNSISGAARNIPPPPPMRAHGSSPVSWDSLGAAADRQRHSESLIFATRDGTILRCPFQKLEGFATAEGLWLTSTATNRAGDCFRLVATAVGREARLLVGLPTNGSIRVVDSVARWERPGLAEEYSASIDGVRQDYVISERPPGQGGLRVELELLGARAEAAACGAHLIMDDSGRKLAYSRLRAVDARGRQLFAKIEVDSANRLAVLLDDQDAEYPVRIDPTFSDANWVSLGGFPGINPDGLVYAIAVDDVRGLVYIGGSFNAAGAVIASNVAEWNGTSWQALGSGVSAGGIEALAVDQSGNLYAGGTFTNAGGVKVSCIAKWDGSAWSDVGGGMGGGDGFGLNVDALVVDLDNTGYLYVGGDFTTAGGNPVNYVVQWDGSTWTRLGTGVGGEVYALALDGFGGLYVGGYFATSGVQTVNNIAQWDGTAWSALGSGMGYYVTALTANPGGDLYAGGPFTTAGGVAASHVAKWDGTVWSALGTGVNGTVDALAVDPSEKLYVGGNFPQGGGVISSITTWNGSAWSSVGAGLAQGAMFGSTVYALTVDNAGELYAGGSFTVAGGGIANDVAQWNGSAWSPLGAGTGGGPFPIVTAVAVDAAANLYAGGTFTQIDGVFATNIARWNGSAWSPLGLGIEGTINIGRESVINALAVDGAGNLYAGGTFTNAGGMPASNIAEWNGGAWSPLGSGVDSTVWALALDSSNNLYAGGYFNNAGGAAASHVAKWNGSQWSSLGSGMNTGATVFALATDASGNLYAGGYFTNAGGVAANDVAKWDGSAWAPLGSGMASSGGVTVSALAVDQAGDVFAGGLFASAGGVAANNIAEWNGHAWAPLSSGVTVGLPVYSLAFDDSGNLYVGGAFYTAGAINATQIAKWDGSAWSALGSGLGGGNEEATPGVCAVIADHEGHLYVGGGFTIAGDVVSPFVAQADLETLLSEPAVNTNGTVTFNLLTSPGSSSRILAATNLTPPVVWLPIYTNIAPPSGAWQFTDTNAGRYPFRFYRSATP